MAHAFLSPSGSHTWYHCQGAPGLKLKNSDKITPDETSYASEGTRAHELAENSLLMDIDPEEAWETLGFEGSKDEEMIEHIRDYISFIKKKSEGANVYAESRQSLFYSPKEGGTVDTHFVRGKTLGIIDLKYGAGVSVQAEHNSQQIIYGASIIKSKKLDVDTIEIYIYQPRVIGEHAVREWIVGRKEFDTEAKKIGAVARKILKDPHSSSLKFAASEGACRFCDNKAFCSTYAASLFEEPSLEVVASESPQLPAPETLTVEQQTFLYKNTSEITKWLKSIGENIRHQTESGGNTGYKIVEGKLGNRKWENPEVAEKFLLDYLPEEKVFKKTLITAPQAATVFKKAKLPLETMADLDMQIIREPGKPALAPLEDPREALVFDAEAEFDSSKTNKK